MKKIILVIFVFLCMNVQANDEIKRTTLNIEERTFAIKFSDTEIGTRIFFTKQEPENAIIQFLDIEVKTEKKVFAKICFLFQNFVQNYKIGETNKKKNLVFFTSDINEKFPYAFYISFNNLKLLNNRDFGATTKEWKSFDNGGMVYPIRTIIKKGKFKIAGSSKNTDEVKQRFQEFLKDYSFGLYETTIESSYLEMKKKK